VQSLHARRSFDLSRRARRATTSEVVVRVYGPLNDFLPPYRRQRAFGASIDGRASVKDLIESLGIPHPEIDLVLANDESVSFDYAVQPGDRLAVFPRFMALDVEAVTLVRPSPLHAIRFVADVHLGKLARHLRLVGLDTVYAVDADDAALADLAAREGRILLTRDQGLLKRRQVAHGYYVRETRPHGQLIEVLRRFGPLNLRVASRCLRCNGLLHAAPKSEVDAALPPRTRQYYERFDVCNGCGRVYWKGSHWTRLARIAESARVEVEAVSARRPDTPEP
jgi:uncharacterized protein with PIN domain